MKEVNLDELRRAAKFKEAGYLEECLRTATRRTAETVEFTDEAYEGLARKYTVSFAVMANNFKEATARWLAAGLPIVSEEVFEARARVCNGCVHWDAKAWFARCELCGCTRLKLEWATERCPIGKWQVSR